MAISFVATAQYGSSTAGTSFTLNKPTGTSSGDFMVAILAIDTFNTSGGDTTVTPPTGWTSVGHVHRASSNLVIDVMTRTAGASEPTSWSGSMNQSEAPKASIVATYRGTAGIAVDGTSNAGTVTSFSTATVNNPDSSNWRMVCAAYVSASTTNDITSNEVSTRDRRKQGGTLECAIFDSNGTIASGNTSRTVSRAAIWESAASWIGIVEMSGGGATNASAGASSESVTSNQPRGGVGAKAQVVG